MAGTPVLRITDVRLRCIGVLAKRVAILRLRMNSREESHKHGQNSESSGKSHKFKLFWICSRHSRPAGFWLTTTQTLRAGNSRPQCMVPQWFLVWLSGETLITFVTGSTCAQQSVQGHIRIRPTG